jgi:hypothetical protein
VVRELQAAMGEGYARMREHGNEGSEADEYVVHKFPCPGESMRETFRQDSTLGRKRMKESRRIGQT